MRDGIVAVREPLLVTQAPNPFGLHTLLAGGRWEYVSLDGAGSDGVGLLTRLDGLDWGALPKDAKDVVETLVELGTLEVVPYDARPPRLLVLDTYATLLCARLVTRVAPRWTMAFVVRHLDSDSHSEPGWAGSFGERAVAALHRVAAYPFATTRCLPVALATFWLLRRRREPASFCLAVVSAPFEAHVWVRHRGRDLDPRSEAFAGTGLKPLGTIQ